MLLSFLASNIITLSFLGPVSWETLTKFCCNKGWLLPLEQDNGLLMFSLPCGKFLNNSLYSVDAPFSLLLVYAGYSLFGLKDNEGFWSPRMWESLLCCCCCSLWCAGGTTPSDVGGCFVMNISLHTVGMSDFFVAV